MKKVTWLVGLLLVGFMVAGCGGSSEPSSLKTNSYDKKEYGSLDKYLKGKTFYSSNYVECNQTQLKHGCEDLNYLESIVFDQTLSFMNSLILYGYDKGESDKQNIRVEDKRIVFVSELDGKDGGYLELVEQTDKYLKFKDFNEDGTVYASNPEIILFLKQEDAKKYLNDQKIKYGAVSNPKDIVTLMKGKTFYLPSYVECKDDDFSCKSIDQFVKITFDEDFKQYKIDDLLSDFTQSNIPFVRDGNKFLFSGGNFIEFTKQTDDYLFFRFYNSHGDRDSRYDRRYYFDENKARLYYDFLKRTGA